MKDISKWAGQWNTETEPLFNAIWLEVPVGILTSKMYMLFFFVLLDIYSCIPAGWQHTDPDASQSEQTAIGDCVRINRNDKFFAWNRPLQ